MSKLPRLSGRNCVKILQQFGFYLKRQEGSHIILRRDDPFTQVQADRITVTTPSGEDNFLLNPDRLVGVATGNVVLRGGESVLLP